MPWDTGGKVHRGLVVVLPVAWAFIGKFMDQKINESADFGLCETAGGIDGVDTLGFQRQIRDRVLDQALFHRFRVQKAGQIGDAEARDRGIQQALAVVDGQPTGGTNLTLFTRGRGQFPHIA